MGVPKFYRWISERYPTLSAVVKEFQLPEFDNLYLDMNGIVHTCSHPEDDNPHFRITEEQIFRDISHYIEFLFRMIKPRKVFFMAIDGVAPRAKMNQQRGRRFRSAREAEELIRQAIEKGEIQSSEKRFDSNCITPGTAFMKRLQDHLKYMVVSKVSTDPLWQGPKIILSGQETPGEGEHKVMDFIRYSRSQPEYDHNTRHCLYGLDADLIMLGLASHEPHFSLLREEVRFGGRKDANRRPATPEETTFHLLHLSLLRDYLDCEFSALKTKLLFPYDLEKIIDDWILMGFLVGNDFIPHLPNLHIQHDALPYLWQKYMDLLPSIDGYLHDGGHLNLKRFEKYLAMLAENDREHFGSEFMDMKYLEGKRAGNKPGKRPSQNTANGPGQSKKTTMGDNAFGALVDMDDMDLEFDEDAKENGQLEAHLKSQGMDTGGGLVDSDEDGDTFEEEFMLTKRNYYMTHMHYNSVTPEVLLEQACEYVRGIQWILLYYYDGVQSWSWYYPFHYAPYVSDVQGFSKTPITFDMAEPFKPFEQLMAVLPAASKELLPEPFQELMTNEMSPIVDFYPQTFETDLNGKQQPWEAVVLIPFVDEKRLLQAMRTKQHLLKAEEVRRNAHGPAYMYQFSPERQGLYPSAMPGAFPDIVVNYSKVCEIPKFHFCLEPSAICKGLLSGVSLDVYFAGFPNLGIIPFDHNLEKCGVKVFQANSRGFNMMLKIRDQPERRLEVIADELLGQTTWVGWPHMQEAKVFAVMDEKYKIEIQEHHKKGQSAPVVQWKKHELDDAERSIIYSQANSIKEKYQDRYGIQVGKTTVLIHAGLMTGRKYVCTSHGKITAEKQFSSTINPFALQATRKDILSHTSDDMHFHSMEELFHKGAAVFMLGNPHYGCQGEVLDVNSQEGRVRVSFSVLQEPDFSNAYQWQQMDDMQYMPSHVAAQRTGLNHGMLSRITGTVLILQGDGGNKDSRVNIGLALKFTKRGEEVPGYTKKIENGWVYSQKCVDAVNDFVTNFPDLWDYVASSKSNNNDMYTEVELFPEECEKKLKDVREYLKTLPCSKISPMKWGSDIVEDNTIAAIQEAVDRVNETNSTKRKKVTMQVKSHLLYRPLQNQGTLEPDPGTKFEKFDRVVAVKMGYSVPFGMRGTVVGVHPGETEADTLYDIIFDQEFPGGIQLRCTSKRGYRVPGIAMLNLTHDARKSGQQMQFKQKQLAAANPWQRQFAPNFNSQGYQGHRGLGQGQSFASSSRGNLQEGAKQGDRGMNFNRQDNSSTSQYQSQQSQFVTPKFPSSNPRNPSVNKPLLPAPDNSDFSSIWSQLQQSTAVSGNAATSTSKSAPHSAAGQKGASIFGSPNFGSDSLKMAAEKLGKIPLPSPNLMDVDLSENPPTGILVDLSDTGSCDQTSEKPLPQKSVSLSDQQKTSNEKEKTRTVNTRVITNSNQGQHNDADFPSKNSPSVLSLFEKASKAREQQQRSPTVQPAQTDKVQALFEQVQKPTSIADDPTGAGSSEFSNIFAALQVAPKPSSPSNLGAASHATAMDGSTALKQMLKIGMNETASAEPTSKKSYGKQVSVQELFDVAKQVPAAAKAGAAEGQQLSTAQQGQHKHEAQHQQQQQQQQQKQQHQQQQHPEQFAQRPSQSILHPLLPGPPQMGTSGGQPRSAARKPVDELATFCQNFGKPSPKYEFNYHHKQKGFICLVTLPTGARFEGSLTLSKNEAAESAASMALLCLRQAQAAFSGQRGGPWVQRPGPAMGPLRPGQQLFSSNSAFSRVPPPMMRFNPAMFNQPPPGLPRHLGQRARQPLLSQPPISFPNRGTHPITQPPPMPLTTYSQAGVRTATQLACDPIHPPPNQVPSDFQTTNQNRERETASQCAEERGKEKPASAKSSTEAFIPLQVARLQRKKEEIPEKQKSSEVTEVLDGHPHSMQTPAHHMGESHSRSTTALTELSVKSTSQELNGSIKDVHASSSCSSRAESVQQTSPRSSEKSGSSSGKSPAKEDGGAGCHKKRRPRIAANFAFGPSK